MKASRSCCKLYFMSKGRGTHLWQNTTQKTTDRTNRTPL